MSNIVENSEFLIKWSPNRNNIIKKNKKWAAAHKAFMT